MRCTNKSSITFSRPLQSFGPRHRKLKKPLEKLKEGKKKLAHSNKLILLIADSAEEGREVVNENERRDLADDGDDDKQ